MGQKKELPAVMPTFDKGNLQRPVDLMAKDGDPRKTAYVLALATNLSEYWHVRFSNTSNGGAPVNRVYSPSVFHMWQAEGLLEHEVIPQDKVNEEVKKGRTVKPRGEVYKARKHMAGEHMITVMAGVDTLSGLLYENGLLSTEDIEDVMVATAMHDLNKDVEFQLTRMTLSDEKAGYGQKGYDMAGEISKQKLRIAGVPERIIRIHQAVGHASCPEIEEDLNTVGNDIPPTEVLMKLVLHYVDDIVTNPNVIDPAITTGENGEQLNALDRRCIQNERNPNYINYNEAWRNDPRNKTGETAFAMQRRVGHRVESRLAELLDIEDPLTLPQVISKRIQQDMQATYDRVSSSSTR